MKKITVKKARKTIKNALKNNSKLKKTYTANISCLLMNKLSKRNITCDVYYKVASEIVDLIFE
jgi:hypothetical protein